MKIAVSGATGFIGQAVCAELHKRGNSVHAIVRDRIPSRKTLNGVSTFRVGEINSTTNWLEALTEVDVVVHCAARAHVMRETEEDALAMYRAVNVEGTLNLARQAAAKGIKRFIFLSSIKVYGEFTSLDEAFRADDSMNPKDPYGISKMEAEDGLSKISQELGIEVVCIRPPLVYGPGVKGNFLSLLNMLERGLPLPLGAIHNRRSLVALDNLVDLIITCLNHPAATNQSFLISDDDDISTTGLLRRIGYALEKPTRLIPVPPGLLQWIAKLFNKENVAKRLLSNLQIDITKTKKHLGWTPPVNIDQGLKRTVEWYRKQQ